MNTRLACALALCAATVVPATARAGWEPPTSLAHGFDLTAYGANIDPSGDGTAVYHGVYRDLTGGVWQPEQPVPQGGTQGSVDYQAASGGRQLSIYGTTFAVRRGTGTPWQTIDTPDLTGLSRPFWFSTVAPNGDLGLLAQVARTGTSQTELD